MPSLASGHPAGGHRRARASTLRRVPVTVPLAKNPLTGRATLTATDRALELSIPYFFGTHPMVVPTEQVEFALVDSTGDYTSADTVVFRSPPYVPFLWTRQAQRFNLVLLFTVPQRLPRARRMLGASRGFPFDVRASRSKRGLWVDGVRLDAEDARQAYEALGGALVRQADSPRSWFERHREVITDPVEREQVTTARRRHRGLVWVAGAMLVLALVALVTARLSSDGSVQLALAWGSVASAVGAWLLMKVVRRADARTGRRRP